MDARIGATCPAADAGDTTEDSATGSWSSLRWPTTRSKRPLKIRYLTQVSVQPPTFVLFANRVDKLLPSYEKFLVLLLISSIGKEANATGLSRLLDRNPNTLSTILDRMEKDGLVKKTRDTTDRRLVYVAMTEKGKKIVKAAKLTGDKLIEKFTGIFTPEERQTIQAFTTKLDKVIADDMAERTAKVKKPRRGNLD